MIALQSTSQVVYTIDDKRFSCYTDVENREIAKLLLNEESLSAELVFAKSVISTLTTQNKELQEQVHVGKESTKAAMQLTDQCMTDNAFLHQELSIVKAKNRHLNTWNYVLAGINGLLLTLILK